MRTHGVFIQIFLYMYIHTYTCTYVFVYTSLYIYRGALSGPKKRPIVSIWGEQEPKSRKVLPQLSRDLNSDLEGT